ncbi:MAG: glutaredoxin 3 [Pseudomonadales bacterium]|nr:glutaredoxin 3 [Pseudomonadales bacterium]
MTSQEEAPAAVKVVMYSTRFCPFCMRARALLQQKQVHYKDIAVDGKPELRQEMVEKSGRYTVPQIWIGETHVGGCDELMALERAGKLDPMLAGDEGAGQ